LALFNKFCNDGGLFVLAFSSMGMVRDESSVFSNCDESVADALDSLAAVRLLVQRLMGIPDRFWKVVGGDVGSAKLMRPTLTLTDGAEWVFEEVESGAGVFEEVESARMPNGTYDYYAFAAEKYLRAALSSLACNHELWNTGRVVMRGTFTVEDGEFTMWTNTTGTALPLNNCEPEAQLPVDLLRRYCSLRGLWAHARIRLKDIGGEAVDIVVPGKRGSQHLSQQDLQPLPPETFPAMPIWQVRDGDISRAKFTQAELISGGWAWIDVESAGMEDGKYIFVTCYGEDFIRVARANNPAHLSAGATVVMFGSLEVKAGALDLWTYAG